MLLVAPLYKRSDLSFCVRRSSVSSSFVKFGLITSVGTAFCCADIGFEGIFLTERCELPLGGLFGMSLSAWPLYTSLVEAFFFFGRGGRALDGLIFL